MRSPESKTLIFQGDWGRIPQQVSAGYDQGTTCRRVVNVWDIVVLWDIRYNTIIYAKKGMGQMKEWQELLLYVDQYVYVEGEEEIIIKYGPDAEKAQLAYERR